MWDQRANKIALLELMLEKRLFRRKEQAEAWNELTGLRWIRSTGRQDERALAEEHGAKVEALLDRMWPNWHAVAVALQAHGLKPSPRGVAQLEERQRRAAMPGPFPASLNRHTAMAAVSPHSKAVLTEERRQALGDVDLTRDGIARLRPHRGFALRRDGALFDPAPWISLLGEVAVPERALRAGLEFAGPTPDLVLLVENLGTYIDIPAPLDWLVVHVPGWDTCTAALVLERYGDAPLVLFGDLDPAGVKIAAHLRAICPALRWVIFDLWRALLPDHALRTEWPEDLDLRDAPPLVQELARGGLWLEQERLVLHPGLADALAIVARPPTCS